MKTVFMVAEKPSLAASLANILSNGKNSSRKGFNGACSVHEWNGMFGNSPARFKMTSVCGHVFGVDFISKYNNWDRVDPVELFSCPIEKKEAMAKLKMPAFLAAESKGCDNLVLWLDCDKEGENICFEVMNCVSGSMLGNVHSNNVTYRAHFSAITEKDIKAAFNNLGYPNENEARSVDARQELDLRIGCAFTRFQTKFFQGDHPPITPMKAVHRNELDGDSWRLYDYITRHFIGTLCKDCKYLSTTITVMVNNEVFTATGKTLLDPGYTAVMTWQAIEKDEIVPNLSVNESVPIKEAKLSEHQTCPPDYLTESELITLMEKHGIGTDASIPVHINNISQRNYVTVISGRKLKPTPLGIVLVHGYQKIDEELVLPTMRSAVEKELNLIALGKADFGAVLKHTIDIFRLKFQYFVKNIDGMDQLFEVSFSPLSASGRAFSRCGKCRRYMKYIQAKPMRLHCSQCDETYGMPQTGNIKLFRELKCPLDDFELLCWTMGNKGRSYVFCPYCYNNPPFKDMKKESGCNSCLHPTCPYSLHTNGVCNCAECDYGVMVLDPSSGPKWKLGCNRCDTIILLFDDALKVAILEDSCKECSAQKVHVEYKPDKSKLPKDAVEMKGCPFCTPEFERLVERPKVSIYFGLVNWYIAHYRLSFYMVLSY
nr:unnamed protein product [Callosobruchus chinensis]